MKNNNNDTLKWEKATNKVSFESIFNDFKNLKKNFRNSFHWDMYNEINKFYRDWAKIIEVWWQYWVSLLLQNKKFDKTLLDIDKWALEKWSMLAEKEWQKINIIHWDMYNMSSIDNESYDIVFNAGVLEHFNYNERVSLLKEYSRILKKWWVMIIAIPNHYSLWYRLWYKIHILLRQWKIPEEYKIYDMKKEINENWLELLDRKVVSPETIINFFSWSFFWLGKIFSFLMYLFNKIIKLDWYLTILTIKKNK